MNYPFDFARLREFVREVQMYYGECRQIRDEPLIVSRAMVSYAMQGLSEAELSRMIESLHRDGYILSAVDNRLAFRPGFAEGQCSA
jgi:hypothetical protein